MKVLKQCIGVDVSKDSLPCCAGYPDQNRRERFFKTQPFENSLSGFKELCKWVKNLQGSCDDIWYIMEATGVYYENPAYWLLEKGQNVSVLLPSKVNHYARTLEVKTKTGEECVKHQPGL